MSKFKFLLRELPHFLATTPARCRADAGGGTSGSAVKRSGFIVSGLIAGLTLAATLLALPANAQTLPPCPATASVQAFITLGSCTIGDKVYTVDGTVTTNNTSWRNGNIAITEDPGDPAVIYNLSYQRVGNLNPWLLNTTYVLAYSIEITDPANIFSDVSAGLVVVGAQTGTRLVKEVATGGFAPPGGSGTVARTQTITNSGSAGPDTLPSNQIKLYVTDTITKISSSTNANFNAFANTFTQLAPTADFGDAPDAGPGTAQGNYNTTFADGGPYHLIGEPVYLGIIAPDADNGQLQNAGATADNLTNVNDEDGIPVLPVINTTSTTTKLIVTATNLTSRNAVMACWIDFNRDGDFDDLGEGTKVTVFAGTGIGTPFELTFSGYTLPSSTGPTYIRCRISTNWFDPDNPSPIGPAGDQSTGGNDGEVEDFAVNIIDSCTILKPPGIKLVPATGTLKAGVQFTVTTPGGSINNIASVQCQTSNIDVAGMVFVPAATSGPSGTPPTWTWNPAVTQVQITARKSGAGSAWINCTVNDDNSPSHSCGTDPVIEEVVRVQGQPVTMPVNNGKPLPATYRYVKIQNGLVGLSQLEIRVNGTSFKFTGMKSDQVYYQDIASALRSDVDNVVTLTARGIPNSSAGVFFSDGPID